MMAGLGWSAQKALTGVFTSDVYGGSPEWERNL